MQTASLSDDFGNIPGYDVTVAAGPGQVVLRHRSLRELEVANQLVMRRGTRVDLATAVPSGTVRVLSADGRTDGVLLDPFDAPRVYRRATRTEPGECRPPRTPPADRHRRHRRRRARRIPEPDPPTPAWGTHRAARPRRPDQRAGIRRNRLADLERARAATDRSPSTRHRTSSGRRPPPGASHARTRNARPHPKPYRRRRRARSRSTPSPGRQADMPPKRNTAPEAPSTISGAKGPPWSRRQTPWLAISEPVQRM